MKKNFLKIFDYKNNSNYGASRSHHLMEVGFDMVYRAPLFSDSDYILLNLTLLPISSDLCILHLKVWAT